MGAMALVMIILIAMLPRLILSVSEKKASDSQAEEILTEQVSIEELKYLSFCMLSAQSSESRISTDEFREVLAELYAADYVLIDCYDIVDISEDGSFSYKESITVPEGKHPLVIFEMDISYNLNSADKGTASKLILENGNLTAQYTNSEGQLFTGDYDFVTVLESFISEHSDFSYNGARAVLGVSGSCGIFGYRTVSYFASEEDNPYSQYGTFDVEGEIASASELIDELKMLGYHFACCGFEEDISYGAEYSIVEEDISNWMSETAAVIGDVDIMLLPRQTDIGSWSGYSDNAKYTLLAENGFSYYIVGNNNTPYLLQVSGSYVRMTTYEIFTFDDFESVLETSD